jgi:hypothetical protein
MKDAPSTSQATCVKCNRPAIGGCDDPKVVYTGPVLELCIRCLNKQVFQLWNESSSWSEIVALNHAFVSGKTWSSTTQGAPLDPESAPLIPGLKRLHDYGIITTSSQPYSHGKRVTADGETLEYKQRPFLEFTLPTMQPSVPKDKMQALIHALVAHDTMCASVWSNRDKYPINAPGATDIQPLTDDDPLYAYRTSTTETRCPCVTKVRKAQTQEELSTVPWDGGTRRLSKLLHLGRGRPRQAGHVGNSGHLSGSGRVAVGWTVGENEDADCGGLGEGVGCGP